jgi:type II secretion system protein H
MIRRPRHSAFTLIELVLVLVIISTAMALAAPSLSGWSRGSRLRDAGDQFLAVARYARTQALANCQMYRLNVDSQGGRYWLTAQDGQQFVPLGNEFGRMFTVDETMHITVAGGDSKPIEFVEFYPTGRTRVANVRIAAGNGEFVDIVCPTPAEGFSLANEQERPR